jgi:hypothetical protein
LKVKYLKLAVFEIVSFAIGNVSDGLGIVKEIRESKYVVQSQCV